MLLLQLSPQNCFIDVGPFDFRDAENVDGIVESSHKNGIYSLTRNVTECVKVWMNQSKVGPYTNQIAKHQIWTIICKYYAAKVDLNMNPACSAHLMNGADARFCLLKLHT